MSQQRENLDRALRKYDINQNPNALFLKRQVSREMTKEEKELGALLMELSSI